MEKYESKQHRIERPAAAIYPLLSDFTLFTPILQERVEEWEATPDSCSFKVQGFRIRLDIIEREPNEYIKISGGGGSPMPFTFWLQLKEVAGNDTRMRLVLHIELNMMMRMMVGSKVQQAVDQMAQQIAEGLNAVPYSGAGL